ncbi:MAG: tetratricopeptide repeat protein, partial [Devosia sp.]
MRWSPLPAIAVFTLLAASLPLPALGAKGAAPVPLPAPQRDDAASPAGTPPAAAASPAATQQNDAATISQQVFGPRIVADDAYGAYQRGAYLTALAFALPRAQNNDHAAQTLIGEIYTHGLGVAQDDKKAAGWFDIASRHGDMLAAFELAILYQTGSGVPKDGKKAAALFKQAADSGYAPAKYNLA